MLLSKTKAIEYLRSEGWVGTEAEKLISSLQGVKMGARFKYLSSELEEAVRVRIERPAVTGMRPVSESQRARILK
jgi:hypothetical protein